METNRVQKIVGRNLKDDSILKKPGVCRKERPDKEKGDGINKSVFFIIIIIMFNVRIEPVDYGRLIIHGFVPLMRLFVPLSSVFFVGKLLDKLHRGSILLKELYDT
jgi:hypothetical protein